MMLYPGAHRETDGQLRASRYHEEEEALERVWTLTEKLDTLSARAIDWDRVVAVAEELHVIARSMRSIPRPGSLAMVPPGDDDIRVDVP